MKKTILALATVVFLGANAFALDVQDRKEENKQAISTMLVEQFSEMGLAEEDSKPFADCIAEKCVEGLSDAEVEELINANEENPPSEELTTKLNEIVMACAETME